VIRILALCASLCGCSPAVDLIHSSDWYRRNTDPATWADYQLKSRCNQMGGCTTYEAPYP
jgi:hypothetical protein